MVKVHEIEGHPGIADRGDDDLSTPVGERLQTRLKKRSAYRVQDEVGLVVFVVVAAK